MFFLSNFDVSTKVKQHCLALPFLLISLGVFTGDGKTRQCWLTSSLSFTLYCTVQPPSHLNHWLHLLCLTCWMRFLLHECPTVAVAGREAQINGAKGSFITRRFFFFFSCSCRSSQRNGFCSRNSSIQKHGVVWFFYSTQCHAFPFKSKINSQFIF